MEPQTELRTGDGFEQHVPESLPKIHIAQITVFSGKPLYVQELDQLAVFGEQGLIVVMARVGNEVGSENFLSIKADGFRHVECELDH
jgi:hypothetical protein